MSISFTFLASFQLRSFVATVATWCHVAISVSKLLRCPVKQGCSAQVHDPLRKLHLTCFTFCIKQNNAQIECCNYQDCVI